MDYVSARDKVPFLTKSNDRFSDSTSATICISTGIFNRRHVLVVKLPRLLEVGRFRRLINWNRSRAINHRQNDAVTTCRGAHVQTPFFAKESWMTLQLRGVNDENKTRQRWQTIVFNSHDDFIHHSNVVLRWKSLQCLFQFEALFRQLYEIV